MHLCSSTPPLSLRAVLPRSSNRLVKKPLEAAGAKGRADVAPEMPLAVAGAGAHQSAAGEQAAVISIPMPVIRCGTGWPTCAIPEMMPREPRSGRSSTTCTPARLTAISGRDTPLATRIGNATSSAGASACPHSQPAPLCSAPHHQREQAHQLDPSHLWRSPCIDPPTQHSPAHSKCLACPTWSRPRGQPQWWSTRQTLPPS